MDESAKKIYRAFNKHLLFKNYLQVDMKCFLSLLHLMEILEVWLTLNLTK